MRSIIALLAALGLAFVWMVICETIEAHDNWVAVSESTRIYSEAIKDMFRGNEDAATD